MSKIFLDCGANNSCSARIFRKLYDPNMEYSIYSFECEPNFYNNFSTIPNLEFINKAVWIEDGEIDFYRDSSRGIKHRIRQAGGSLIKEKTTAKLDKKNPIKVESIEFSKWVMENFNKDDYIILKMDIEGAEYKVLEKMISDGTMDYINELWIEWHWKKIGMSKQVHITLLRKIKKMKIPIKKWDAIGIAEKVLGKGYWKR